MAYKDIIAKEDKGEIYLCAYVLYVCYIVIYMHVCYTHICIYVYIFLKL